jgi:G protein-coupled receptor 157
MTTRSTTLPPTIIGIDTAKMELIEEASVSVMATTAPLPQCPTTSNCTTLDLSSIENGHLPSYVAIFSSGFSCLGSILIVVTFFALKDMRSGAQKIITFLALADFVSAAGYIVGSVNFLTHYNKTESKECKVFEDICVAQATITSWSSLVSFLWTAILAFYFYLIIVYRRVQVAARLMPLYHIVAWGFPLFIVIPLVATGHLGYAPYAASNWCFVKNTDFRRGLKTNPTEIIIILFDGKLWELLTYIIITVLFILISAHITKVCG